MTEIERIGHLRYKSTDKIGISTEAVAGENQSIATDPFSDLVASQSLNSANAAVIYKQRLSRAFGQNLDADRVGRLAKTVNQFPAGTARQKVHSQGRMAGVVGLVDHVE